MKFEFGYTYIDFDLTDDTAASSSDYAKTVAGLSPEHQLSLRSAIDISKDIQANIWFRYVDKLEESTKPGSVVQVDGLVVDYLTLDANVSWNIRKGLELMLVGQNLLDSSHLEYVSEFSTPPTEIPRSIYCKLTFQF